MSENAMPVNAASSVPVLTLKDVRRFYTQGRTLIDVLRGVNLSVGQGETVALLGPSGAGKSTLLHVTGLLEYPDEGEVFFNGMPCSDMNDDTRTKMRREYLGFVYQSHNLLPEFSARENVMLPQMIAGVKKKRAAEYADFLLEKMGLQDRRKHRPAQLSGGEAQRVAIARALANKPRMLLADEPTGNLDSRTGADVMRLFHELHESGNTIVLITHDAKIAAQTPRAIHIHDGRVLEPADENEVVI